MKKIEVENNIKIAETLPSSFYKSEVLFEELKEKVFYKSWQLIDHESVLPVNTNAYPFDFIKDYINEPLVLIKDDNNDFKCLDNKKKIICDLIYDGEMYIFKINSNYNHGIDNRVYILFNFLILQIFQLIFLIYYKKSK